MNTPPKFLIIARSRVSVALFLLLGGMFILSPKALADSWLVSGGAETTGGSGILADSNGCYVSIPDGTVILGDSTSEFQFGAFFLISATPTVYLINRSGNNYYQNTTGTISGAYDTGTWIDGNDGFTPAPTFTHFDDNACGVAPPPSIIPDFSYSTTTQVIDSPTVDIFLGYIAFYATMLGIIWIFRRPV